MKHFGDHPQVLELNKNCVFRPSQTGVHIDYLHSGTEYQIDVRGINEIGRGGIATIHQYTKLGKTF